MWDTCSPAPHTRLTCHQRIYGGIRWDQFVRLAILTAETLTDLKTDLVMANNNNSSTIPYELSGGRPRLSWHHNSRARHHSTVFPRLGSSRMESHQNLHTHAVDSTIQLQGNNRVLKKRPPPISDEEQRFNRRQRCTLLQLRSGHSHLLQDYKHRVFGEPSDICTDCSLAPHTRLTCHQRIYGGKRGDQFVCLATSTTETTWRTITWLYSVSNNGVSWQNKKNTPYIKLCFT